MDQNEIDFLNKINSIIDKKLEKLKLLNGNWQLGQVISIIDSKHLNVSVNGSVTAQPIPCNPDVEFHVGDSVWVIFVNGDSKNKFVLSHRAV